jgi:hypothetical protein
MREILSIGKSIKIIRYLEGKEKKSEAFVDFKKIYDSIKLKEITCEPEQHQLDPLMAQCSLKHLNNIWDASYKVVNLMSEST